MEIKKIQTLLKKFLLDYSNVEFAYLFGSYADGTFNDRSDVDIAVYLKDVSFDAQLDTHYQISKIIKKDLDMVVLNTAKNLYLLDDIFKKGIVLKDSDERLDFEVRKEHQIIDYKEFKKSIDASI